MNNGNSSATSGGIGFMFLLTILFIALKLMGYITWSWWLVLLPIWGPALLFVVSLAGLAFIAYRR